MDIQHYKDIFENYGGMMRTKDLEQEKIRYRNVQQLIEAGLFSLLAMVRLLVGFALGKKACITLLWPKPFFPNLP